MFLLVMAGVSLQELVLEAVKSPEGRCSQRPEAR
jgi:hypothetical protein